MPQDHYIISLPSVTVESPAFDAIYLDHYNGLYQYARTLVTDEPVAEEMVHQVFWKLLENKEKIKIQTSLKAYLYRSVYYECLNHLKHERIKRSYALERSARSLDQPEYAPDGDTLQYKELEKQVKIAINKLPEQCRTIFQLSRFEELKYAEIASQLGLSIKTVETQMSRALKKLRVQLAEYLPLMVWALINFIIHKH